MKSYRDRIYDQYREAEAITKLLNAVDALLTQRAGAMVDMRTAETFVHSEWWQALHHNFGELMKTQRE